MARVSLDTPALAISLGGTNTTVAAATLNGRVLSQLQFPSIVAAGATPTIAKIAREVRKLIQRHDPVAIGVAVGAPFDPKDGIIQRSAPLRTWEGVNVIERFHGFAQGRSVLPLNDAKAGDRLGRIVVRVVSKCLGVGIANLTTICNPERIIVGGIYPRQEEILKPGIERALASLANPNPGAAKLVQIVPAELGEQLSALQPVAIVRYSLSSNSISGTPKI